MNKTALIILSIIVIVALLFGGSYNSLVRKQELVSQNWGQVQASYQRRLDLIPNLVATVQAYAKHEKDTFLAVTKARSMASNSMHTLPPTSAAQLQKFSQSQDALSSVLSRLMLVVERYPDLKANQNFLALQQQLASTENLILNARQNFNTVTQHYDTAIRQFPGFLVAKLIGGFTPKPYFKANPKAATAPVVKFE